jgi:ribosomal protein S18 acetylase RimI-like enzyme
MAAPNNIPARVGDPDEIDYSAPAGDPTETLARDRFPVRSMTEADLPALIEIDRRTTGRDRTPYYQRKVAEALHESGVRVSLIAESDRRPVGFVMARVDFGEFGQAEPEAVMDTIGVDPAFHGRGVGQGMMSQLLINLATLRVERVRTEVDWNDFRLLGFLDRCGFRPSQRISFRRDLPPA